MRKHRESDVDDHHCHHPRIHEHFGQTVIERCPPLGEASRRPNESPKRSRHAWTYHGGTKAETYFVRVFVSHLSRWAHRPGLGLVRTAEVNGEAEVRDRGGVGH